MIHFDIIPQQEKFVKGVFEIFLKFFRNPEFFTGNLPFLVGIYALLSVIVCRADGIERGKSAVKLGKYA